MIGYSCQPTFVRKIVTDHMSGESGAHPSENRHLECVVLYFTLHRRVEQSLSERLPCPSPCGVIYTIALRVCPSWRDDVGV